LTKIILFLDILKFPKKNRIDIWFLEKLGIDCITFYETVSSLLKTIGTSLEKKSQQRGTGHSLIQNFLFETTGNQRLVTKTKNHTILASAPHTQFKHGIQP
jgi:hypothetical protein